MTKERLKEIQEMNFYQSMEKFESVHKEITDFMKTNSKFEKFATSMAQKLKEKGKNYSAINMFVMLNWLDDFLNEKGEYAKVLEKEKKEAEEAAKKKAKPKADKETDNIKESVAKAAEKSQNIKCKECNKMFGKLAHKDICNECFDKKNKQIDIFNLDI